MMQRSSVTLAKGCSTIRLGSPGDTALPSGWSAQSRHQRAIAQHQFARFVVRGGREPQRAAGEHEAVEHQPAARADRQRDVAARRDQRPGPIRAGGDHDMQPGRGRGR